MLTTVLTVTSAQEITVLVWCADPPCFFPEGWAFAQTFLLPEMGENLPSETCVAWTKQIGSGRIKLTCTLTCLNKTITLTAFVDTAADVMIISQDYWLPEWTLVPSLDALVGIRGTAILCGVCTQFLLKDLKIVWQLQNHLSSTEVKYLFGGETFYPNGV